ncbi:MAG: DUF2236 domain-containing protein [Sandaracinaceae bacterium]|nr:DUF2236 domain-containing protein [Sandaracinaceae bacterium]
MHATRSRTSPRRATPPAELTARAFDPAAHFDGMPSVYAALANVCMQLSYPPVGRGVLESKVDSGNILKHPVKRGRTTLSYLAVAQLGDEATREAFRKAVDGQHRQVRSDTNSPVKYNAFDQRLQLWVAACLYKGSEDIQIALHGPMDADTAEAFYQYGACFGTTLQLRRELWPADRAAFEAYWQDMVQEICSKPMAPDLKLYLRRVLWTGRLTSGRVSQAVGAHFRRMNIGFLPPEFREHLGVTFSAEDQRYFDRHMRRVAALYERLPRQARLFPYNLLLWDVKRRIRFDVPIV